MSSMTLPNIAAPFCEEGCLPAKELRLSRALARKEAHVFF